MALVALPCDLPHWPMLQRQLNIILTCKDTKTLIDTMFRTYHISSTATGLDPDDSEKPDPGLFVGLQRYLDDLPVEEKCHVVENVIAAMAKRALELKMLKPVNGMQFSLQQQPDKLEYKRCFLASLLSNAFFSTFPKRTPKTHPTLQDFNFVQFFQFLDQPCQQAKLQSFFHYFELLETQDEEEFVEISRQVMNSKQWLTIEDWMESETPLCNLLIRHDGRLDDAEIQCLGVSFSSQRLGGAVLQEGTSKESVDFSIMPEMTCILSSIEALEDNEAMIVRNVYKVSTITDPRNTAILNKFEQPLKASVCCIDAEKYTCLPLGQLAEDNLLRELNKSLLGFRQGRPGSSKPITPRPTFQRRLSPIGESFSSNPSEIRSSKEESPPRTLDSPSRRAAWLRPPNSNLRPPSQDEASRRGRFIVLGSSGECLPVNRPTTFLAGKREVLNSTDAPRLLSNTDSMYSSAVSEEEADDDEVFHSARTSVDFDKEDHQNNDFELSKSDEGYPQPNTIDCDETKFSLCERLNEAYRRGDTTHSTSSEDQSNEVRRRSLSGSHSENDYIRHRRGTSIGFVLEESLDDGFYQESLDKENNETRSDEYSFASDCSEFEEIYGQLTRWLRRAQDNKLEDVPQERMVSALQRAFSDSVTVLARPELKTKVVAVARSLSLELFRRNPKLAPHMFSLLSGKGELPQGLLPCADGLLPIATGNWGCGSSCGGDTQVKFAIQWLAASCSGTPSLVYYTCRHHKLLKVDTIRRILMDRKWTVGELTIALLKFSERILSSPSRDAVTLFDCLLGSNNT